MNADQAIDEAIENCAELCDLMAKQLKASKLAARHGRYDRQTPLRIDYAIRTVHTLSARIRAQKGKQIDAVTIVQSNGDRLIQALTLIREVRPTVARARASAWKQATLHRIDEILG